MKKCLGLILGVLSIAAFASAEDQKLQMYETQIATSAFAGFATAKQYVSGACRVYRIDIANPGSLTQSISGYDSTTQIFNVESDNAENVTIEFDEPLVVKSGFSLKTATHTASSYATVHYRPFISAQTPAGNYRTYYLNTTSGTVTAVNNPVEVGQVVISNITTAQTITLYDGSTAVAVYYVAANEVRTHKMYDTPVKFSTSLKVKSSAAKSDCFILIHYRNNPSSEWKMATKVQTNSRVGISPTGKIEVAEMRIDSQSTAETITVYDGTTAKQVVYMADDATYAETYEHYALYTTSITAASSQATTPGYLTIIYRKVLP